MQVSSRDKDFRYMAASDLQAELSKSTFKADVDMQKKLTKAVLQQLEDASGDISSLAVKWWVPLLAALLSLPYCMHACM